MNPWKDRNSDTKRNQIRKSRVRIIRRKGIGRREKEWARLAEHGNLVWNSADLLQLAHVRQTSRHHAAPHLQCR
jgi:hypothetical protein